MSRPTTTVAVLTVGLVLVEVAIAHGGHAPLGAFAVAGVAGSLVLGLGAKALGLGLQRPASDDEGDRWEEQP